MKKAIIKTGSKQYLVSPGDCLAVELLDQEAKTIDWQPLLVIDGEQVLVGQPLVEGASVKAKILESQVKSKKVTSIRFKAKKRVDKRRGHRQLKTLVEITSITLKKSGSPK